MKSLLRAILVLIAVVAPVVGGGGCADRGDRVSAMGLSRGVLKVGLNWQSATMKLDPAKLASLFWDACLVRCRGFKFAAEGTAMGGTVAVYRWAERKVAGSLVWDLAGQMASYKRVKKAQVLPVDLSFYGERVARARFRIHVDGVMKTGHRRSDRGEVEVWLENRGLGTRWWVTGLKFIDMFTVVARRPGFKALTRPLGLSGVAADPGWSRWKGGRRGPGHPSGPGMALADVNGDGHTDIFIGADRGGRIWLNRGEGKFTPLPLITAAGNRALGGGVTFVDLNSDSRPDLFMAFRKGGSLVLLNQGAGRFQPPAKPPAFTRTKGSVAAVFMDANGDNLLDVYLVNHAAPGKGRKGEPDQLWLSTGPGRWDSKPVQVGRPSRSRAACVVGPAAAPGLVVVDDFGARFLKPLAGRSVRSVSLARMMGRSCLSADLRGNGMEDLLLVGVRARWRWMYGQPSFPAPMSAAFARHRWTAALMSAGRGSLLVRGEWMRGFPRAGASTAVHAFAEPDVLPPDLSGWDRIAQASDVDLDGAHELTVVSGVGRGNGGGRGCLGPAFWAMAFPRIWKTRRWGAVSAERKCYGAQPSVRLLWRTPRGAWVDIAYVLGLELKKPAAWVSWADLDGDGASDLVVRHTDGTARAYLNLVRQGNFFSLKILGPDSNRASVGAVIRVFRQGLKHPMVRRLRASPGLNHSGIVAIGLGAGGSANAVDVRWPDGRKAIQLGVRDGVRYTLRWDKANAARAGPKKPPRVVRPFTPPRPSRPARPGVSPARPGTRPARPGVSPARPGTRPARPAAAGSVLGPSVLPAARWSLPGGGSASLQALRGARATVVYLWAPGCRVCRKQAALLVSWAAKRRGVVVAAAHLKHPCAAGSRRGCAPAPKSIKHLLVPGHLRRRLVKGATLPRTLVYDRSGKLRTVLVGPPDKNKLDRAVGIGSSR